MANLGSILTPKEIEHFKGKGPLPKDWFKKVEFLSNKEEEPSPYKLFFDYMIGGAMVEGLPGMFTTAGGGDVLQKMLGMFTKMPPFTLMIWTRHPERGNEFVRINMSPFSIKEGPPKPGSKEEPDLILKMEYPDLVRLITDEEGQFIDPFCDGLATIEGDMSVFLEFEDMFDVFETMFGMGESAKEE